MKRSKHRLSNYQLFTGDLGQIIPCGLVEVLPGDTFQHSTSLLVRMSPMVAPVMHPLTVRLHHFFVPHRLTWPGEDKDDGWEQFITGGKDGNNASTIPTITSTGEEKDILDYLGIPPVAGVEVSALPVRAFNMVFNEWYADQDLVTPREEDDLTVPYCAWEKDMFTAARPFEQKGPAVTLPLGTRAPVIGIGKRGQVYENTNQGGFETGGSTNRIYASSSTIDPNGANYVDIEEDPDNPGFPGIYADLSSAEAIDVNDFRRAFAIQRYQEARARYGSRYTEYLRFLGINPKDSRLQRPEYLGGGRTNMSISEVLQTAPEDDTGPANSTEYGVGDMYGHGIAAMRSNRYRRFFDEHGYVISCMSIRPKAMYTQGIPRTWLKTDKHDFFQKELQFIGQQPVYNNEVYADPAAGMETFGYQDRYKEYRESTSAVHAEFRSLLNYWHLGRTFDQAPVLNGTFVECNPTKRIFAEQTQNSLWVMAKHNIMARRLVSRSSAGRII